MKKNLTTLFLLFNISIILFMNSCKTEADKTFDFVYTSEFQIGENEIYEGINTLGNLSMGEKLNEVLAEQQTTTNKIEEVTIKSATLSFNDTTINFSDLNNFTLDILGKTEKTPMRTIANISDVDISKDKVELQYTKEDLAAYFKDSGVLFIPSGEASRDISESFGMKLEVVFNIGVKN